MTHKRIRYKTPRYNGGRGRVVSTIKAVPRKHDRSTKKVDEIPKEQRRSVHRNWREGEITPFSRKSSTPTSEIEELNYNGHGET